jgi:formyl-CoA transferase
MGVRASGRSNDDELPEARWIDTERHALGGIVVLGLGQIYTGPYCTHLLRSLGATVIKSSRSAANPSGGGPTGETSGQAFLMLNAGKQGVRLDLKNPRGRDLLLDLVRQADVLVGNFAPGVLDRLGISWEVLHEIRPELVLASARAYGAHPATEGLRGMDVTVQAMSGIVSATGFPDCAPVKAGAAVVDFAAGAHLAAAVLAALSSASGPERGNTSKWSCRTRSSPLLPPTWPGSWSPAASSRRGRGTGTAVWPYAPTMSTPLATDGWPSSACVLGTCWNCAG